MACYNICDVTCLNTKIFLYVKQYRNEYIYNSVNQIISELNISESIK